MTVTGSVEHEEPIWRIVYHDEDGEDIPESEVRKLNESGEVQILHWVTEEENRTNAQW